jgi:integrase
VPAWPFGRASLQGSFYRGYWDSRTRCPSQALSNALAKSWLEERRSFAGLWEDHNLLFTTQVGTPIYRQDLITRCFKPLLRRAGLPNIRFHDLRHTCATLLLGRGVHAKLVQELLGHATIAVTLDTYSHVLPSMGNQTATAMEDVFS